MSGKDTCFSRPKSQVGVTLPWGEWQPGQRCHGRQKRRVHKDARFSAGHFIRANKSDLPNALGVIASLHKQENKEEEKNQYLCTFYTHSASPGLSFIHFTACVNLSLSPTHIVIDSCVPEQKLSKAWSG